LKRINVQGGSDRVKIFTGSCLSGLGIVMKKSHKFEVMETYCLEPLTLFKRQDQFFYYEPLSTSSFRKNFNPIWSHRFSKS